MPRTRSAPAVDRPRRRYPAKDDPARLALAGRIPDAALGALIGCGRSAVSAWRRTRTPPIPACDQAKIPRDLWWDVQTIAVLTGADVTPWAPTDVAADVARTGSVLNLDWQGPPTWGAGLTSDGDTP
jgi:hypothetical protein